MEIIDIGLSDLEPISLDFGGDIGGSNFGSGIELLMNDKKKAASGNTNVDLGDLNRLEDELNELSGSSKPEATKSLSGLSGFGNFASSLFGGSSEPAKESITLETSDSNIGYATVESMGNTKTWDGFTKLSEVPQTSHSSSSKLSDREKRRKQRAMIQKLQEWYEKGLIKNNSGFSMESNFDEVEDEYESALEDKRKKDSVKLQGWWFTTFVNSIEYANSAFDPFNINLDGWGEQVSEDLDSYDEIFSELYDKYKGGKLSPEISLMLRLGFSAAVVNFSNKALSSATPAFNDVIKQSPELMRMFTNATVSSMSQNSPGFAMANNLMKDNQGPPMNMGPPPAPVETKGMMPPSRPGASAAGSTMNFTNRPDIAMGRGAMFREQGVDMNMPYENPNQPPRPQMRPEMRGPQNTDIDNILAGLKPRTVDLNQQRQEPIRQQQQDPRQQDQRSDYGGDDSMISIESLKDMQGANIPKQSRRRRTNTGSARNTVSLDI